MRRIRIDIQNIMTNVIIGKRNEIDIPMIENIFAKKKSKGRESNIDISDNSWKIIAV